jgi:hypothetical protein
MHWPLGIGESVAGIIVIGFSVDYVVHLGHMLEEADHKGIHMDDYINIDVGLSHILSLTWSG